MPLSVTHVMSVAIWLASRVLVTILEVAAIVRTRTLALRTANGLLLGTTVDVEEPMSVTGTLRSTWMITRMHLRRLLGSVATAGRSKSASRKSIFVDDVELQRFATFSCSE